MSESAEFNCRIEEKPRPHKCQYRDDGGGCIFCGKTVPEQLEEEQLKNKNDLRKLALEVELFELKSKLSKLEREVATMKTPEQILLNYLNDQFPAVAGHIPLKNMIHDVWLDGVKKAYNIAEREEKYNEMDTRISTRIKDLLK